MGSKPEPSMEYRAVVKYATSGKYTTSLKSGWLPHRDMAEEIIEDFEPCANEWGEVFDTAIERKEVFDG